jgi:hypothetical protein
MIKSKEKEPEIRKILLEWKVLQGEKKEAI